MKREIKFPTVLGLFIAVGGLLSGLWLVQNQVRNISEAAAGTDPERVVITNVTDNSFTASWITGKSVSGFIQYGETPGDLALTVGDDRDQETARVGSYLTHYVTVKGLKPETTYNFKIGSGEQMFDLSGTPYLVTTGATLTEQPAADVAYGQVVTMSGEPAEGAIVYAQLAGSLRLSALVKTNGSWAVPLSTARTAEANNWLVYDKRNTELAIEVDGGAAGMSTRMTTTDQDSPVEEIVLGQDTDTTTIDIAEAEMAVTDLSAQESKLTNEELILLTPYTGEKVNSSKPVIIGKAPAGTEIQVTIHSDTEILDKVTADENGGFTYNVPTDLEPGVHSITISAMVDGVIKQITRSFTVYAAGENFDPAYSATPSATPLPTSRPVNSPTATPRANPTATPIPTSTPTPSPTTMPIMSPTVEPTTTISPTPATDLVNSGSIEYTLITAVAGILVMTMGMVWYKKA